MQFIQQTMRRWSLCCLLALGPIAAAQVMCAAEADFEPAASVFIRRCLECHNTIDFAGGLDLTRRDAAMAGGDSGAAIMPSSVDESSLIDRVVSGEMPP